MSVTKMLSRVVTPNIRERSDTDIELDLHDYTFGITSDPLTQFAVCFSALIHDGTLYLNWDDLQKTRLQKEIVLTQLLSCKTVDHRGVSNAQLVKGTSGLYGCNTKHVKRLGAHDLFPDRGTAFWNPIQEQERSRAE